MTDDFVAGFVAGEGCFEITPAKKSFRMRFEVGQRADNGGIIQDIHKMFGFGYVDTVPRSGNPFTRLDIMSKDGCQKLIQFFDQVNLGPTAKQHEFELWKKAFPAWLKHDWQAMATVKKLLAESRRFKG